MKLQLFSLSLVITLMACSTAESPYKGVYSAEKKASTLELPPNLSKPNYDNSYDLPEQQTLVKTYSDYEGSLSDSEESSVLKQFKGARFVREGNLYWVEVAAEPDVVWRQIQDFFAKVGFSMKVDQPLIGFIWS